jgi:signal transduction histidine kinase
VVTGGRGFIGDELSALRRVATLVAQGVPAADLFHAVSEEVGRVFGEDLAAVMKFDDDGATIVGLAKDFDEVTVGTPGDLGDRTATGAVYRTGRSARVDRGASDPPLGALAGRVGVVSSVSSPIVVDGRLWGAVTVAGRDRLPRDAEEQLADFTELLATAIANAESRDALERLAEEQAALRRVATLVARGDPAESVFMAVSEEVAELFGEGLAAVCRFDADRSAVTFVGIANDLEGLEVGTHVEVTEETPAGMVYVTGRPARLDLADWSTLSSAMGRIASQLQVVSSVASPIIVEGRLWGVVSALGRTKPLPPDTPRRLERFSELIAMAIANSESKTALAASRRRIVTASDDARRRIERNLHDGTQQRLVSLGLSIRAAEADVPPELGSLRSQLSKIATGIAEAAAELQEISRGIHPANLAQNGIGAALRTLARRSPIPVDVEVSTDTRLPEPVEVAAYYAASEALTNAAKHARATRVDVSLRWRDDDVLLSINDDGIGGADPASGSGLVGLIDRVTALGGAFDIQSVPGAGTRITAEFPLTPGSDAQPD